MLEDFISRIFQYILPYTLTMHDSTIIVVFDVLTTMTLKCLQRVLISMYCFVYIYNNLKFIMRDAGRDAKCTQFFEFISKLCTFAVSVMCVVILM